MRFVAVSWILLSVFSWIPGYTQSLDSLKTIRAFEQVTPGLASSGIVLDFQYKYISDYGFKHVISLLPGDQSREDSIVRSMGISFKNIQVDWKNPTQKNLEAYFGDMETHSGEKIFLHCQANMRASVFLFLYRVIQQGNARSIAKAAMDSIWYPVDQWHDFIGRSFLEYGLDPVYRTEPAFVTLIREKGSEAAEMDLSRLTSESESLPFRAVDLGRLAEEYSGEKRTGEAIQVYRLITLAFPDYLWAKRMLGKLGVDSCLKYWEGIEPHPQVIRSIAGTYDMGETRLNFVLKKDKLFLETTWSKKSFELYSDSPTRYFVHENNWLFEFSGKDNMGLKFVNPRTTLKGKRIMQ